MTMLDLPVHTTLPIKVMSQSSSGCLLRTILQNTPQPQIHKHASTGARARQIPVNGGSDEERERGVFGAVLESDVPSQRVQVLEDSPDLTPTKDVCTI